MSNEFTVSVNMKCQNGYFFDQFFNTQQQFNQTAGGEFAGEVTATTTAALLPIYSEITIPGVCVLMNCTSGTQIQYGPAKSGNTMQVLGNLQQGFPHLLYLDPTVSGLLYQYVSGSLSGTTTALLEFKVFQV